MASSIRGLESVVFLNTGSYDAPTWVEWTAVIDASLSMDFGEVDVTTRGSGGVKVSTPTLTSIEVSGSALKDKDDATQVAMELAAQGKTAVEVLVLDGPRLSSDSDGWRMSAIFSKWEEQQPLEGRTEISWTLIPTRSAHKPVAVSGPQASTGDT